MRGVGRTDSLTDPQALPLVSDDHDDLPRVEDGADTDGQRHARHGRYVSAMRGTADMSSPKNRAFAGIVSYASVLMRVRERSDEPVQQRIMRSGAPFRHGGRRP